MSIQKVGHLGSNRLPDALGQCKQTRENLPGLQGCLRSLGGRIIVLVQARMITQLASCENVRAFGQSSEHGLMCESGQGSGLPRKEGVVPIPTQQLLCCTKSPQV